jgi:histidine triad (HIT) family protein
VRTYTDMKDDNCIFCKLANGEIPTRSIYQDDTFRVILDADPATRGHALILPKDHYANLFELPDDVAAKAFVLAKNLASVMKERLHADGFNLVQNNGEIAGQTVFHFHLHLIPRYNNDGNREKLCWNHESFTEEQFDEIRDLLDMNK